MCRVDFFFKISKRDFTFIREMRVPTSTWTLLTLNWPTMSISGPPLVGVVIERPLIVLGVYNFEAKHPF